MRKAIALFLLLSLSCFGSDVVIPGAAVYTVLGRSLAWGTQVQNNYVFNLVGPNENVCLYILNNNPTSAHSYVIQVQTHGDLGVKGFTGVSGWRTVFGPSTYSVAASTASPTFIRANGAAKVVIGISGVSSQAGTPDTADIYAVQTGGACSSSTPWSIFSISGAGGQATVSRAGSSGTTHFVSCVSASMISTSTSACTTQNVFVRDGVCGSGTVIYEQPLNAGGSAGSPDNHFEYCGLNLQGSPGNTICVEFAAAGGASCVEGVDMIGFDQ